MSFIYDKVENPVRKNSLEIVMAEINGWNDNADEDIGFVFSFYPEGINTKERAENFLKGFFHIIKVVNNSRVGEGQEYEKVNFNDESGDVQDIQIDYDSCTVYFSSDKYDFYHHLDIDKSMRMNSKDFFSGIYFDSAFYYDENGDKFQINIKQ